MREIIFYAPLGYKIPEYRIGGAESGCRRTLGIYRKADYHVHYIDKPAISRGKLIYALGLAFVPLHLVSLMLIYKKAPVHIVGFYCKLASYELFLIKLIHLFNHKVIYEMRNGNAIQSYNEGSNKYRRAFSKLITTPEIVFGQGEEIVRFIYERWKIKRNCYPNYVSNNFLQERTNPDPGTINLIYFGRVTEEKNIDVCIRVLGIIRQSGYNACLHIVGAFQKEYKSELDQVIKREKVLDQVIFHGRKDSAFILNQLLKSRYFLFPSSNVLEGHSNSLTEAMAVGVVPVVSKAGFNESVCDESDLIVDCISAEKFAKVIIKIEKENRWEEYSIKVRKRIEENYTEDIVGKKFISTINSLYE